MRNSFKKTLLLTYFLTTTIVFGASDTITISQTVNTGTSTNQNNEATSTTQSNTVFGVAFPISAPFLPYNSLVNQNKLVVQNILVEEGDTFILLSWTTNNKTKSNIVWGQYIDGESGSIIESNFDAEHSILLRDLKTDKRYFIKISSQTETGEKIETILEAHTKKIGLSLTPPNVENPLLEVNNTNQINISWEVPNYSEFKSVRVVRSNIFFPQNPYDGEVVYEGKERSLLDSTNKKEKYFYTIFLQKSDGRFSSGVTLSYNPNFTAENSEVIKQPESIFPSNISLKDFNFIQEGKIISNIEGTFALYTSDVFKISIASNKTPRVLKTIIVTLTDNAGKRSSFLLRTNDIKSEYEAIVSPASLQGSYSGLIQIFDYKNGTMNEIPFSLDVLKKRNTFNLFIDRISESAIDIQKNIREIFEIARKLIEMIFQYIFNI